MTAKNKVAPVDPTEIARILHQYAESIRKLAKRSVEDTIEIGRLLTDAKRRIPHGDWLSWLKQEFGWSDDTATNYMRLFQFSRGDIFRKIRNKANFSLSVLCLLARSKAPDALVRPIVQRIDEGERVPGREVRIAVTGTTLQIPGIGYIKEEPQKVAVVVPSRQQEEIATRSTVDELPPVKVLPPVTDAELRSQAKALLAVLEKANTDVVLHAVELLHGERRDALTAVKATVAAFHCRLNG